MRRSAGRVLISAPSITRVSDVGPRPLTAMSPLHAIHVGPAVVAVVAASCNGAMTPPRLPLIVVKRRYFDQFVDGSKTVEYRLHRPPYTVNVFYPGRLVRVNAYYDWRRNAHLVARVIAFNVARAADQPAIFQVFPGLSPDAPIAAITLHVERIVTP